MWYSDGTVVNPGTKLKDSGTSDDYSVLIAKCMSMYIFHLSPFLSYDLFKCSDLARSVFVNSTVFVSGPKSALVVAMCCVVRLRSCREPVMKIGLRFICYISVPL